LNDSGAAFRATEIATIFMPLARSAAKASAASSSPFVPLVVRAIAAATSGKKTAGA